ncbi:benzoate 4-monooxygenase cytochrome P450 [Penicillium canariense]|uniref:Benzoate 4-monooxygenase cytochrome P450 n=1 Tax=Penicillium canariense TaxID=189055 RepID=A0A9W9LIT7_9EURO|nr:benzoate 4-monooxygenase cytochrome P450 [Penicillium canariense]KAJ5157407.1 benzoate 4-monooxygenase cytochrome P450 [Penicillium canariense]
MPNALIRGVSGTDAPSQVMAITMYHVLNNARIYDQLQDELQIALPGESVDASWSDLEHLPYLGSASSTEK